MDASAMPEKKVSNEKSEELFPTIQKDEVSALHFNSVNLIIPSYIIIHYTWFPKNFLTLASVSSYSKMASTKRKGMLKYEWLPQVFSSHFFLIARTLSLWIDNNELFFIIQKSSKSSKFFSDVHNNLSFFYSIWREQ